MEKEIDTDIVVRDPRVYEIGYLLLPNMTQDEVDGVVSAIQDQLGNMSVEHISHSAPQLIDLAYTMMKVIENKNTFFDTAYFGWLKFAVEPHVIEDIESMIANREDILRSFVIKTVREDTMVDAQPMPVASSDEINTPESHKIIPEEPQSSEAENQEVNEAELEDKIEEITDESNES